MLLPVHGRPTSRYDVATGTQQSKLLQRLDALGFHELFVAGAAGTSRPAVSRQNRTDIGRGELGSGALSFTE